MVRGSGGKHHEGRVKSHEIHYIPSIPFDTATEWPTARLLYRGRFLSTWKPRGLELMEGCLTSRAKVFSPEYETRSRSHTGHFAAHTKAQALLESLNVSFSSFYSLGYNGRYRMAFQLAGEDYTYYNMILNREYERHSSIPTSQTKLATFTPGFKYLLTYINGNLHHPQHSSTTRSISSSLYYIVQVRICPL